MMNAAVAKRYGQALLQIGQEKNSIDRYQEDLKLVVDTMENSAELKDVLTSQTVSVDEKKNIVKQIFADKVDTMVLNLMYVVVDKNREESIANTLEIMDKCNYNFEYGHYLFPRYVPETGDDPMTFIRKLIDDGVKRKYGEMFPELHDRIEYELGVISRMGFIEYYLIVWDYIHAARKMGISVGPGRGSGAGSIVCYLLGITNIDPFKYDLLFEREKDCVH